MFHFYDFTILYVCVNTTTPTFTQLEPKRSVQYKFKVIHVGADLYINPVLIGVYPLLKYYAKSLKCFVTFYNLYSNRLIQFKPCIN